MFLVFALFHSATVVYADDPLVLKSTQNPFVTPGAYFETTVAIESAQDLVGFQFRLVYDEDFFELISYEQSDGFFPTIVENDTMPGLLSVNYIETSAPLTGDFDLFTVTFKASDDLVDDVYDVFTIDATYLNQFIYLITDPHQLLTVGTVTYDFAQMQFGYYGDLDGDGVVSVFDTALLDMHIAGLITLDHDTLLLADADLNGVISIFDRGMIQQYTIALRDYLGEQPLHLVEFETYGGTEIDDVLVWAGEDTPAPADPVKEGYTFAGWYTTSEYDTEVILPDALNMSTTLHAKWDVNPYTLSFDSNGGSLVDSITQDFDTLVIEPEQPVLEGHSFAGWYEDEELTTPYVFGLMPAYDDTVYAAWTINDYTITFDVDGGSPVPEITLDYAEVLSAPDDPVREGHTFAGWFEDDALLTPYVFDVMPAYDHTVYAAWTINIYTMSFDSNGGSDVLSVTEDFDTVLSVDAPTRTGYSFDGWYADESLLVPYVITTMPADDLTLYAGWTINQYTLTFESNGGTGVDPITDDYDTPVTEPVTERTGHTFEGWFVDVELVTPFEFTTMPADDLTIHAAWTINEYYVSFDSNGGSTVESGFLNYDTDLTEAEFIPIREGFIFAGWFEDSTMTSLMTRVPDNDHTLHTHWIPVLLGTMVTVGLDEQTYAVPIGVDDIDQEVVNGGFTIATAETTYELWYDVLTWAVDHGYAFENLGIEGSRGVEGDIPVTADLPVTNVSWRDVIVWMNALSEMGGLDPVYRTEEDVVIRSSENTVGSVVDGALMTDRNGYRLPVDGEWEMAARWTDSTEDMIPSGGRYWTPGSFASGSTDSYDNQVVTNVYGWFFYSTGYPGGVKSVQPIAEKTPNTLGLYDMSGNVSEWMYTTFDDGTQLERSVRGGSYYQGAGYLQVGYIDSRVVNFVSTSIGFRIAQSI